MLHTFVAHVQDKPGVLTRVASLFRRLNINIVSLTVGESERTDVSRMTIVCEAPDHAANASPSAPTVEAVIKCQRRSLFRSDDQPQASSPMVPMI